MDTVLDPAVHVVYLDDPAIWIIQNNSNKRGATIPGWYYWDESMSVATRPFTTQGHAANLFAEYVNILRNIPTPVDYT